MTWPLNTANAPVPPYPKIPAVTPATGGRAANGDSPALLTEAVAGATEGRVTPGHCGPPLVSSSVAGGDGVRQKAIGVREGGLGADLLML